MNIQDLKKLLSQVEATEVPFVLVFSPVEFSTLIITVDSALKMIERNKDLENLEDLQNFHKHLKQTHNKLLEALCPE